LTVVVVETVMGMRMPIESHMDHLHKHMGQQKPWFCGSLHCPEYVVIKKTDHYEKRCYDDSLWAASSFVSEKPTTGLRVMYRELWSYFNGNNHEHSTMKLTTPVLLKYTKPVDNKAHKKAEMHFYYPDQNAIKIATAYNRNVNEKRFPAACYYVSQFERHIEMEKQLDTFRAILKYDGIDITKNYPFYLATYYKTDRGKHIEIMFRE